MTLLDTGMLYLNEMPYWATLSKPLFQTRVTSQAFVACSRQERKAETALPPTRTVDQHEDGSRICKSSANGAEMQK